MISDLLCANSANRPDWNDGTAIVQVQSNNPSH